jgi:hypothetical protein
MRAEVAVLLQPGSLEDTAAQVSEGPVPLVDSGSTEKKIPEKLPVIIDFSAYCDCV